MGDLQWKTTSNGRLPQNIEGGIYRQLLIGSFSNFKIKKIKNGLSQQPLIGSSSNVKLKFGGLNQN
jgi:hypothetical protein